MEHRYAISRQRACEISIALTIKLNNGDILNMKEQGMASRRKSYLNAGRDRCFEITLQASRDREAKVSIINTIVALLGLDLIRLDLT